MEGPAGRSARGQNLSGIRWLWRDEEATASVEYALMLGLVVLSALVGYHSLGDAVGDGVRNGSEAVEHAGTAGGGAMPAPDGPPAPPAGTAAPM